MAGYSWDLFEELRRIQDRMGKMLGEASGQMRMGTEVPSIDIMERGDDIIVTADAPGVDKSDVKINVTNDNVLEISAEKKMAKEQKEQGFVRHERSYNRFYRSITLPAPVDKSKAKATYNNGVLEIILPMVERARTSDIPIS